MPKFQLNKMDLYDLSNIHFENCTLLMKDGKQHKGKFVRLMVKTEGGYQIYPSEKFCFLPQDKFNEFKQLQDNRNQLMDYLPDYILQLDLTKIKKIVIEPSLI